LRLAERPIHQAARHVARAGDAKAIAGGAAIALIGVTNPIVARLPARAVGSTRLAQTAGHWSPAEAFRGSAHARGDPGCTSVGPPRRADPLRTVQ